MRITRQTRLQLRLQNSSFILLLLALAGLLAWLSTRYDWQADWTASNRHSLSEVSRQVLAQLPEPITITAYASADETLRGGIADLIALYQRQKPNITLRFIDPVAAPGEAREKGITQDGELFVEYQQRSEHLVEYTEASLTQAMQRLLQTDQRWVAFLEGHGERSPLGQANHDFGFWASHLKSRGIKTQALNIATAPQIPDNTSVLVLAGARVELLPEEVKQILDYVDKGGDLLWLLDPGKLYGLEPLAQKLGLSLIPGTMIDPGSVRLLGAKNQTIALVAQYAAHPLTKSMGGMLTLFPEAAGLKLQAPQGWTATTLFSSYPQTWAETGDLQDSPKLDKDQDTPGPLDLALALTRPLGEGEASRREQRIVLVGDGDFLSNAYVENSGNLDLGVKIIHWLARDEQLLNISAKIPSDQSLSLGKSASLFIALTFLFILPLGLLGMGFWIWRMRKRR